MSERNIVLNYLLSVVTADTVDWNEVSHDTVNGNVARIEWPDPQSPNGVILLYELELTSADLANVRHERPVCSVLVYS